MGQRAAPSSGLRPPAAGSSGPGEHGTGDTPEAALVSSANRFPSWLSHGCKFETSALLGKLKQSRLFLGWLLFHAERGKYV